MVTRWILDNDNLVREMAPHLPGLQRFLSRRRDACEDGQLIDGISLKQPDAVHMALFIAVSSFLVWKLLL